MTKVTLKVVAVGGVEVMGCVKHLYGERHPFEGPTREVVYDFWRPSPEELGGILRSWQYKTPRKLVLRPIIKGVRHGGCFLNEDPEKIAEFIRAHPEAEFEVGEPSYGP